MATKHAEPNEVSVQPQTNSSKRILVVDDDAGISQLNAKASITSGYQVDTAEDGAVAWAALQDNSYDLLIADNTSAAVATDVSQ